MSDCFVPMADHGNERGSNAVSVALGLVVFRLSWGCYENWRRRQDSNLQARRRRFSRPLHYQLCYSSAVTADRYCIDTRLVYSNSRITACAVVFVVHPILDAPDKSRIPSVFLVIAQKPVPTQPEPGIATAVRRGQPSSGRSWRARRGTRQGQALFICDLGDSLISSP